MILNDGDWCTKFLWQSHFVFESLITIEWQIEENTPTGIYRIQHFGNWKSILGEITEYSATSSNFKVVGKQEGRKQGLGIKTRISAWKSLLFSSHFVNLSWQLTRDVIEWKTARIKVCTVLLDLLSRTLQPFPDFIFIQNCWTNSLCLQLANPCQYKDHIRSHAEIKQIL